MRPRTGTVYKAGNVDELAPHSKVLCSTLKVKTGVVVSVPSLRQDRARRKPDYNMLLPGEPLLSCDAGLNLPFKRSGLCSNVWIQGQHFDPFDLFDKLRVRTSSGLEQAQCGRVSSGAKP